MNKIERTLETPRYIKLNPRDNVAIVVNDFGLPAGSQFACGLTLRAFVPQGHKTALSDIGEGEPIIRYGETIGFAASHARGARARRAGDLYRGASTATAA
jgi:galactarate dehydratase